MKSGNVPAMNVNRMVSNRALIMDSGTDGKLIQLHARRICGSMVVEIAISLLSGELKSEHAHCCVHFEDVTRWRSTGTKQAHLIQSHIEHLMLPGNPDVDQIRQA